MKLPEPVICAGGTSQIQVSIGAPSAASRLPLEAVESPGGSHDPHKHNRPDAPREQVVGME
jgi:hypothetical protein